MENLSYLKDADFLRALDNTVNKFYWVKIDILNKNELPIESIAGRVLPGSSINIDGSSAVRRTCTISFVAEEAENDLTNIDNLLSINKKIKIMVGLENHINDYYDNIIWFPQGIFVIIQPSISHTLEGCTISLSCKDKMCLLNGECGGNLPTSVTFHEYEQMIGEEKCDKDPANIPSFEPNNYTVYSYTEDEITKYKTWTKEYGWHKESNNSAVGTLVAIPQKIYDIVQTLVCNYGGVSLDKILINDVPLEIKQIVRYVGSETLYYNMNTSQYTTDESYTLQDGVWKSFKYNEDVGYIYTDFVYPGKLVSNIGDNICTILDRVKNVLGNFEYFYDVEGNFVFQEIKNYLNNSYNDSTDNYKLNNSRRVKLTENGLCIIDGTNYAVDFHSNSKSLYTFAEGNGLITSYANTPSYMNLKNDYHIWGKAQDGFAIHYHLAIKSKPTVMNTYSVVFLKDEDGVYTGRLRLAGPSDKGISYKPSDWRAELYLQGLTKQKNQIRPDVYEQELLDLFDAIYDFYAEWIDEKGNKKRGKFKTDLVNNPNELKYFFDYLDPISELYDCSVDALGTKIYSYKQDKLVKLYDVDIPNVIMLDLTMDINSRAEIIERCENEGQPYANVNGNIYANIAVGTIGYSAQETARNLLYQYTNYNESITIQSIPIYYLEANSRITVFDSKSGINGDYIIKSISIPMDARGVMSINATRALERI